MPEIKLLIYATTVPAILAGGGVLMLWASPIFPEYKSMGNGLIFLGIIAFIIEIIAYIIIESNNKPRY